LPAEKRQIVAEQSDGPLRALGNEIGAHLKFGHHVFRPFRKPKIEARVITYCPQPPIFSISKTPPLNEPLPRLGFGKSINSAGLDAVVGKIGAAIDLRNFAIVYSRDDDWFLCYRKFGVFRGLHDTRLQSNM
jgi:hypothetical protein